MDETPATTDGAAPAWASVGNASAEIRETHTGIVVLIRDKAYKIKKPIVTDFLDFSTSDRRERACAHEVILNSRLAPSSYLGIAHLSDPLGGLAEPVIVMRRYPDAVRLSSLVKRGAPVEDRLDAVAEMLASFHDDAGRGRTIDGHGTVDAVAARWQRNIWDFPSVRGDGGVSGVDPGHERLATQFMSGRAWLFTQRITESRIVDGHADFVADDIFCLPDGPVLLDCLEFDDHLRTSTASPTPFSWQWIWSSWVVMTLADTSWTSTVGFASNFSTAGTKDLYIAYRAVVRAKVDCIRVARGRPDAGADAQRHNAIALDHVRAADVDSFSLAAGQSREDYAGPLTG